MSEIKILSLNHNQECYLDALFNESSQDNWITPFDDPDLDLIDLVLIEDTQGLEHLLERTNLNEELEWGTVLKSRSFPLNSGSPKKPNSGRFLFDNYTNGNWVIIYEILDSYQAEKQKLIRDRKPYNLKVNNFLMKRLGYTGDHHYHPAYGNDEEASNFAINSFDKKPICFGNTINLLTFNLDGRPELIAYNEKRIFIPKDRNAPKNELYLVRDVYTILDYLK